MQPANGEDTQRPSARESARTSPVPAETTLALTNMGQLQQQAKTTFYFGIATKNLATTTADPRDCLSTFNAMIQTECADALGIEVDPVLFVPSFTNMPVYGEVFQATVPISFEGVIQGLIDAGKLQFTGDTAGNKYKLKQIRLEERTIKALEITNDKMWGHVIVHTACQMSEVDIYQGSAKALAAVGINIHTTENGFKRVKGKDKEAGKNKFHFNFDIDWQYVPRGAYGKNDLSRVKKITINELTGEWATVYLNKENADVCFGICHECFFHRDNCLGHDDKKRQQGSSSSAANAEAAKKRMRGKAKMSFSF